MMLSLLSALLAVAPGGDLVAIRVKRAETVAHGVIRGIDTVAAAAGAGAACARFWISERSCLAAFSTSLINAASRSRGPAAMASSSA